MTLYAEGYRGCQARQSSAAKLMAGQSSVSHDFTAFTLPPAFSAFPNCAWLATVDTG
jgi:hypothetical protein